MELKYDKWMPVKIWIIAIILLIAVHPVKAEVGWDNFSAYSVSYYTTLNNAAGINPNGTTQFFFDNANYTHLYQWSYNSTQLGTTTTGSDSNFDIVEGGVGTGYAFYTGTGGAGGLTTITWVCSGSCTITSSSFRILYSKQGFQNNFTGTVNGEAHTSGIYTDNYAQPVEMKVCNPTDCTGASQYGALGGYYADVDIYSTTLFNITYPVSGIFNINITKYQAQAATHTVLHDSAGVIYRTDTGFTKTNYTHINTTQSGIYLNASVGTGAYKDILINSTNVQLTHSYMNATNSFVGGSPSGQIYFDTDQNYYFGMFGIIIAINNSNYPTIPIIGTPLDYYYLWINPPSGGTIAGTPIIFNSQNYSTGRNWAFASTGLWNATLTSCAVINIVCNNANGDPTKPFPANPNILDVAIDSISLPQLPYSITTDSVSYSPGQMIHINVSNPSPTTTYLTVFDPLGFSTVTFPTNVQVRPNSLIHPFYYFNYTIPTTVLKGKYSIVLSTISAGTGGGVAWANFTIGTAVPGSDILSIVWDNVDYVGGQNVLSWTANRNDSVVNVSKFVFGNYTIVDNFSVQYNDSNSQSYLLDVPGLWVAKITDNKSNVAYSNLTVIQGNAVGRCEKTAPDYVCWDNASYTRPANFVINFKGTNLPGTVVFDHITVSSPIFMAVYDPDGIMQGNTTIASVTGIYPFPVTNFWTGHFSTTAKTGIWTARMIAGGTSDNQFNDGTVIVQGTTIVIDVPAPGTTVNAGAQGAVGTPLGTIDAWTAMFGMGVNDTSRFLFAIVLIIIFILLGFIMTGNNATGGIIVGFVPYAFFTYINYVPRWFIVVAVIIMGIKLRWF